MPKKKLQSKTLVAKVTANKWVLMFVILAAIAGGLYAIQRSRAGGCGDDYYIEWDSGYVEYVPETQGCGYGGYDADTDTWWGSGDGGQTWESAPATDDNRPEEYNWWDDTYYLYGW